MRSRAPSTGFTLLELLVVMFIVGIIAAMATLSVGVATSEKGTQKEIDRIADLMALASEEAVLQGREFGITFYQKEYEFSSYDIDTGQWTPIGNTGAGPFAPRPFPPEAVIDLEIEDRLVSLKERKPERKDAGKAKAAGKDEMKDPEAVEKAKEDARRRKITGARDPNLPQVFILSSGDVTPFKVRLRPAIGKPGITLKVADNGTVEKLRDER